MDIEIEEKLNFEKFGKTKCNQCQNNHENGQDKATQFIRSECYDNHTSMEILRTHKISSISFEHLPGNLQSALTDILSCKQHRDKAIEFFCKNYSKAVCEKCIVKSHSECKSNIFSTDDEVEEIIQDYFQKRLFDNESNVTRVEKIYFEKKEVHQAIEDKIEKRQDCNAIFIKNSDEPNVRKNTHEKTKEEMQMIKKTQRRIQMSLEEAVLLHNEVCIPWYALKIRESIQFLQNDVNMIEKVVCEQEFTRNDDHDFVKTICSKLQDGSLGYVTSGDKKKSGSFPVLVDTSNQHRLHYEGMVHGEDNTHEQSSHSKCYDDEKRMGLHPKTSIARYQIKYNTSMFPRYKYHLKLIQKIIDREREVDVKTNINDKSQQSTNWQCKKETDEGPEEMVEKSTLLQTNILVYGRAKDEIRKILHPLELQEAGNVDCLENDILVAFSDAIDVDSKTSFFNTIQEQMNKCCWCILVSSETDAEKYLNSSSDWKFSIIRPDIDAVWNHLTSAMELKLIEFLNDKSENMDLPLTIREDVLTVLRRIKRCSVIKENHESNEIPKKIQDVLKRFEKAIVQYGFNFKHFRVVVKNERFGEVETALRATELFDSFAIKVIRQDDFVEKIVPYNAQGMKLAVANIYDTSVSLAHLNKVMTVVKSCRHIWMKDGHAFITNGRYQRNPLGTSCLGTTGCTSDMVIV